MEVTSWRKYPILLLGYNVTRWEDGVSDWKFPGGLSFLEKGDVIGPAEVQYDSKWGFMFTWPLCFVFWWRIKPQERRIVNGTLQRIPGTEKVIFFRLGIRWSAIPNCYELPSFYIGGHYD